MAKVRMTIIEELAEIKTLMLQKHIDLLNQIMAAATEPVEITANYNEKDKLINK